MTNKTIPQLIKSATRHFNEFIRNRDQDKPCISCGKYNATQAGHFYSAGHYPALRFDEDNCHKQCVGCNHFKSGNLIEYEKNLRRRIGDDRVEMLHMRAGYYKKNGYKWDRFHLEEVIREYRERKKICSTTSTK